MRTRLNDLQMKRAAEPNGKDVSKFYFLRVENTVDTYQCKICPKVRRVQKEGSGWTNLMEHIKTAHPNFEEEIAKADKQGNLTGIKKLFPFFLFFFSFFLLIMTAFAIPPKIENVFSWVEWVINEGHPFSFVEKEFTRKHSRLESISIQTLMSAVHQLTLIVEESIRYTFIWITFIQD